METSRPIIGRTNRGEARRSYPNFSCPPASEAEATKKRIKLARKFFWAFLGQTMIAVEVTPATLGDQNRHMAATIVGVEDS